LKSYFIRHELYWFIEALTSKAEELAWLPYVV